MRVLHTPSFIKTVKRLQQNQKSDLDHAILDVVNHPDSGERKVGDLSWLRVFKFRMVGQLTLLAYELNEPDEIILHHVGPHENFYRDLKTR